MIMKETCWQIIYFLMSILSVQTNKQLMVEAENDNNTNNATNNN